MRSSVVAVVPLSAVYARELRASPESGGVSVPLIVGTAAAGYVVLLGVILAFLRAGAMEDRMRERALRARGRRS